jgi:N-acetylglutamate synthase-like GNAT family acetyltransferase
MGVNIREAELNDFEKITELLDQLWPDKELNRNALNVFSTCTKSPGRGLCCTYR